MSVLTSAPFKLELINSWSDVWYYLLDATVCVWPKFEDSLIGQGIAVNGAIPDFEFRFWNPSIYGIGGFEDTPIFLTYVFGEISIPDQVGWGGLGHDRIKCTNTQEKKHSFFHD